MLKHLSIQNYALIEALEIDFEAGIKLFNHVKMTGILSRVESLAFPEDIYMARLEIRVAF